MIKSLSLTNFRRHAELDLRFDDDRQLILVAGPNGVGKSTILEAITFALWGEGRHGRRNLDNLLRRGAELEGMSVELVFTVADNVYRVHRRRDGKAVTAVLYAGDVPLVEGPAAVTAEIAALLGMDAAGFRLAVIAQQKDLDGLASLRPAERAQMITRLLRLDALTAARNAATAKFRSERDIVSGLRVADTVDVDAERQSVTAALESARIELGRSRDSLAVLDAELLAASDVESAWSEAQRGVARIEGAIGQLKSRRNALAQELNTLVVPTVDTPPADLPVIAAEAASIERSIALAETAELALRQRDIADGELKTVTGRLTEVRARLDVIGDPDEPGLVAEIDETNAVITALEEEIADLRVRLGAKQSERADADARRLASAQLGADCDLCGQAVPENHREHQVANFAARVEELDAAIEDLKYRGRVSTTTLTETKERLQELGRAAEHARSLAAEKTRLLTEVVELERRERTYRAQVERIDVTPVDLDALYARKAEIAVSLARSEDHANQVRLRDAALTRRLEVTEELAAIDGEIDEQNALLDAARPGADLIARFEARQSALGRKESEQEMLAHWTTEIARFEERVRGLDAQRQSMEALLRRRQNHEQQALAASSAARLLADVSERLATQIRPSLEGAISGLLSTMSEGRFSAVRVSDEYDITVEDDGKFRPLQELSGGEMDLVALAVRLALSQVVSERHGSGGAGFLILDECFASQDASRRQAILSALRTLRDVYSQIFVISHVENIEDAADMVIEVSTDEDRQDTEVTVS
jgi:exonuclease SbcC